MTEPIKLVNGPSGTQHLHFCEACHHEFFAAPHGIIRCPKCEYAWVRVELVTLPPKGTTTVKNKTVMVSFTRNESFD